MKSFSALDLYYFTKELTEIKGSRIDNFYFDDDVFYMRCYVKTKGNRFIVTKLGKFLFLCKEKEETQTPSGFNQYLRKYLTNGFIEEIQAIENERILKIIISKKESTDEKPTLLFLYLEMFGNGNIVLTDETNIIKNVYTNVTFKDRKIGAGETYLLPPKRECNIYDANTTKLEAEFDKKELTLVKLLANSCGLGGKYAEELCFELEIDKNTLTSAISYKDKEKIIALLIKLPKRKLSPCLYYDGENCEDYAPFEFKSITLTKKDQDSFTQTLEIYYTPYLEGKDEKVGQFNKEKQRLEKRLANQKEQETNLVKEIDELNTKGTIVYENYAEYDELITSLKKALKEQGETYVQDKIKNTPKLKSKIKEFNLKKKELILNVEEK